MTILPHINSFWNSAFFSRIRKFFNHETTQILVHAFVSFKTDYCNSLLFNVSKYAVKKLQSVQNAAVRLITCSRKYDRITSIQVDLYWLHENLFRYMKIFNKDGATEEDNQPTGLSTNVMYSLNQAPEKTHRQLSK